MNILNYTKQLIEEASILRKAEAKYHGIRHNIYKFAARRARMKGSKNRKYASILNTKANTFKSKQQDTLSR
ncbi:MAG: hypothetical protein H8D97_01005 [Proteobacteria bacterium]|nr:hypothetical protein [Pseudomonadota bacterium]